MTVTDRANIVQEPQMQTGMIHVYHDHADWNRYKRWFQIPQHRLDELFITSYEVRGEYIDPADMDRHAKEVWVLHPNTILVY